MRYLINIQIEAYENHDVNCNDFQTVKDVKNYLDLMINPDESKISGDLIDKPGKSSMWFFVRKDKER